MRGYLDESDLWACLGGIVFAEVGGPSLQAPFPGEVPWIERKGGSWLQTGSHYSLPLDWEAMGPAALSSCCLDHPTLWCL